MIRRVVLLGAGRVAVQLGPALQQAGVEVVQVYSRTASRAKALATRLECRYTDDLTSIPRDAYLYILAISDVAIPALAKSLGKRLPAQAQVVHTSGATSLDVIQKHVAQAGVFYPLQTFSEGRPVDWSDIPFCLEATTPELLEDLRLLAQKISSRVYEVSSEQRATLHVAAVFANNFSNYLFSIAEEISQAKKLPFDLLRPLILETARKVQEQSPADAQTGPAVRKDRKTIERHLRYLQQHHPEYVSLYQMLTEGIETK